MVDDRRCQQISAVYDVLASCPINPSLEEFFRRLNRDGILWAIWKGLEHIEAQLIGLAGDIDILITESQQDAFGTAAASAGFVRDRRSPSGNDRDIFVLRHYDVESGNDIMLHVHTRIRLGTKKHKEFNVPIETDALKDCVHAGEVRVVKPGVFFTLRILGLALKDRNREDAFASTLARHVMTDECKAHAVLLEELAKSADHAFAENVRLEIVNKSFPSLQMRREAKKHVIRMTVGARERMRLIAIRRLPRRNKLGPLYIALYGHDGAGKTSTQVQLREELTRFGPVHTAYLGRNRWSRVNNFILTRRSQFGLSFVWDLTSFLELFGRHLKATYRFLLRQTVVTDRGLFDVAIKYSSSSSKVRKALGAFARVVEGRSKSLKILLVCDADVAATRDNSLSVSEIQLRREAYVSFLTHRMETIDTTNMTTREVTAVVLDLAQRHFGRKYAH